MSADNKKSRRTRLIEAITLTPVSPEKKGESVPTVIFQEKFSDYQIIFPHLPFDFSRDLLAKAINKQFGSKLTKDDFSEGEAQAWENEELGKYEGRQIILPLQKFMDAYVNRDRSKDQAVAAAAR